MNASSSTVPAGTHSLAYLDGLRGLAALVVVAHHLALIFYPALLTGDGYVSHLGGAEVILASSPASILVGGHFAVCLFFVLSGLVLSEGFLRTGQLSVLRSQACRRYLRLMLPVAFSALVAWGLWQLGAYQNGAVAKITSSNKFAEFWQEIPPASQVVSDLFINIPLGGESSYNPVFWTLGVELTGSFVVFALLALFGGLRHRPWIYGSALLFLWFSTINFYFAAFILGVWLNERRHQVSLAAPRAGGWLTALLLLGGILLGSYPTAAISFDDTLYRFLRPDWLTAERAIQLWHIVGAGLLLGAVLRSARLQRWLSGQRLQKLGAVSFSLYLLHFPVLGSFTSGLFLWLQARLPYHASVLLAVLATLPVLAGLSYLMYRLVDLPGIRLAQRLYARFFQPAEATVAPAAHPLPPAAGFTAVNAGAASRS